ncbi:hypothetical protein FQN53_006927 [Emmonsiellopsis sp. PD_33]|nr:hypothetical protein FQN53_006927 [Emmonsiellopsis sp. PD_33]
MGVIISRLTNAVPLLLRKAKKQLAALKSKKSSHAQQHQEQDGVPNNAPEPLKAYAVWGFKDVEGKDKCEAKWERPYRWNTDPFQVSSPYLLDSSKLKKYLDSSMFVDFTIKTSEKEFKVHKIILSSQSEYFERMLGGEWKESVNNVVLLDEEDPQVIEAMIHFLYWADYASDKDETANVVFHAMVYSAGERYGIPSLKKRAALKFDIGMDAFFEIIDLPSVTTAVYTSTISTDRFLRDRFCWSVNQHLGTLLRDEKFMGMLQQYPAFSVDLLKSVTPELISELAHECPGCDHEWKTKQTYRRVQRCNMCCLNVSGLEVHNCSDGYRRGSWYLGEGDVAW